MCVAGVRFGGDSQRDEQSAWIQPFRQNPAKMAAIRALLGLIAVQGDDRRKAGKAQAGTRKAKRRG